MAPPIRRCGRHALHRKQPFSLQSGRSALGQPSSARRPASVILTRPTARLPALMFSRCAVASPARMRLASIRRLKPCANIIASLTPNGLLARNWSARRCSAPRRRFRGGAAIRGPFIGQCTPDSGRLAVAPKSAESGQNPTSRRPHPKPCRIHSQKGDVGQVQRG